MLNVIYRPDEKWAEEEFDESGVIAARTFLLGVHFMVEIKKRKKNERLWKNYSLAWESGGGDFMSQEVR